LFFAIFICVPLGVWAEKKRQWHEMWGPNPGRVYYKIPNGHGFDLVRDIDKVETDQMRKNIQAFIAKPGKLVKDGTIVPGRHVDIFDITITKIEPCIRKGQGFRN
jgi:hypothetical protein